MKVLYIVTSFQRSAEDVINPWMVETIRQLARRGISVTVYTSSWLGQGDHLVDGIQVRRFRYFFKRLEMLSHTRTIPDQIKANPLVLLLVPFYILFGVIGLRRVLKLEKFDLVHVHWPFPMAVFGWFAARWAGVPWINEFYGAEIRWAANRMKMLLPFVRWSVKSCDLVVAISSHTRDEILKLSRVPVEIVPYGSPVPAAEERSGEEPDPQRTRRVLFVGRLVERKGVEYLLRAVKEIDLPFSVVADVVGGGPEEARLRRLAEELELGSRVNLAGRVSAQELKEYYRNCDCFVLPAIIDSRGDTEGLGVVLIEALSYRKPVIASHVGGITDILLHEKTGLAVPPKDPQALARAISRVLTDRELALRLGREGYDYISRYFDWGRLTDRWVELYGRLVAGQKR
ncbi:MAG TPA: glycosyltransferase family 4 protein [Candidatus Glassbacteria bacterium]|nr:glycosyltransferase family 4 protein [Candidatus Glassbacteria bacterium]